MYTSYEMSVVRIWGSEGNVSKFANPWDFLLKPECDNAASGFHLSLHIIFAGMPSLVKYIYTGNLNSHINAGIVEPLPSFWSKIVLSFPMPFRSYPGGCKPIGLQYPEAVQEKQG